MNVVWKIIDSFDSSAIWRDEREKMRTPFDLSIISQASSYRPYWQQTFAPSLSSSITMAPYRSQQTNWTRKLQGGAAGFACGSMVGAVGSILHTRRVTPRTLPSAMFMGTVLAFGSMIRMNWIELDWIYSFGFYGKVAGSFFTVFGRESMRYSPSLS